MICPQCQSENRDDAKYCNECGFPLSGKIAQVAAAAAAEEAAEAERAETAEAERSEIAEAERSEAAHDEEPHNDLEDAVAADKKSVPGVPSTSGPLDRSTLPAIDVAGVNVDENGQAFDFGLIEDDEPKREADDLKDFIPARPQDHSVATRSDFTGFDECLVDSGYVAPQKSWKAGDTMEMPRIEDQAAPKQKEFRAPDPHEKKRTKDKKDKQGKQDKKGKIIVIVILCMLVICAGAAGVTYYLELWGGKTLPNVVGMTQTDAAGVLESKGFVVHEEKSKSDEAEGVVLLMDPTAGTREEAGSEVVIHVSEARMIPDVVGKQRDDVAAQLEKDGFENVTLATQKSSEAEGSVLSISPEAGSKAKASTAITLTVAEPYTVPDVGGKTWEEASQMLKDGGYQPQATYVYDTSVSPGIVLSTDPGAGEKADYGSVVTVSVARSRAAELEQAAQSFLAGLQSSGKSVTIGNTAYLVESVDAVKYEGNETTSFTITGKALTSLDGETVYGSSKQKSGSIVWTSSNTIASIS